MPPANFIDLTGQPFGLLAVLKQAPRNPQLTGEVLWLCQCTCGNLATVRSYQLRKGRTKSCGCLHHKPTVNFIDLTGQPFGRLTVLYRDASPRRPNLGPAWICQCSCGQQTSVTTRSLRQGSTRSCGCWEREHQAQGNLKHGGTPRGRQTPEYRAWKKIKERCLSPACPDYPRYGGRGITICPQWQDSFSTFLHDMGPRPSPQHTVERLNNDGPYTPGNCSWETRKVQARNTRNNVLLTYNGETHCIAKWSEIVPIPERTIAERYRAGWPVEKILTTPPRRWPSQL